MCLLCRSYWDFGNVLTENQKPPGYDRVRGYEIGNKNVKLDHLDEVCGHAACMWVGLGWVTSQPLGHFDAHRAKAGYMRSMSMPIQARFTG